jgi:hypothetical protein
MLLCVSATSIAQDSDITKHVIYLEVLGIAGWGSINHEYSLHNTSKHHMSLRYGLSTLPVYDFKNTINPNINLPITLQYQFGKTHKLGLGLGAVYSSVVKASPYYSSLKRNQRLNPSMYISYRIQSISKHFLFQILYCPMFIGLKFSQHWGGLGIGYYIHKPKI